MPSVLGRQCMSTAVRGSTPSRAQPLAAMIDTGARWLSTHYGPARWSGLLLQEPTRLLGGGDQRRRSNISRLAAVAFHKGCHQRVHVRSGGRQACTSSEREKKGPGARPKPIGDPS